MKIVHMMVNNGWGGIQVLFRDCCVEMAGRGHSILAVVRSGSRTHEVMLDYANSLDLISVDKLFRTYTKKSVRKIESVLSEFEPDIVVSHGERTSLFLSKLHSTYDRSWPIVTFVPGSLTQKCSRIVDKIIPHTTFQANKDFHVDLVDPIFSEVIPLFTTFEPVSSVEIKSSIRKIIAVGRMRRFKGFNYLIDAVHDVINKGINVELTIVGDGPEMKRLVRQRKDLGLVNSVHFVGETSQVGSLLRKADLFVLPSVFEPFGIVLLEAMASGVPIVATKTHGPLDIFDNSTAILVDSESATALSEGIQSAIQDMNLTNQLAINALIKFKKQYTPDAIVPRLINQFHQTVLEKQQALS